MGLTADDRDRLQAEADRRQTTSTRFVLIAAVLAFAVLAVVLATVGRMRELSAPWDVIVPVVPLAFLVALLVPMLLRTRRRSGPLVEGTDTATRRAVARAIRDGHSTNGRIDDLVVDLREHGTAQRLRTLAATETVGALALVAAAAFTDQTVTRILLGGAAASMVVAVAMLFRQQRRLGAYRPGGPPAAAKGD